MQYEQYKEYGRILGGSFHSEYYLSRPMAGKMMNNFFWSWTDQQPSNWIANIHYVKMQSFSNRIDINSVPAYDFFITLWSSAHLLREGHTLLLCRWPRIIMLQIKYRVKPLRDENFYFIRICYFNSIINLLIWTWSTFIYFSYFS